MEARDQIRIAEKSLADLCARRDAGADLAPEIRGASVVAGAVGVPIARLAEITGLPAAEIQDWFATYRQRELAGPEPEEI